MPARDTDFDVFNHFVAIELRPTDLHYVFNIRFCTRLSDEQHLAAQSESSQATKSFAPCRKAVERSPHARIFQRPTQYEPTVENVI